MAALPEGVERTSSLLFPDVIRVSDPDLIRKINDSPDMGRPAQGPVPWALNMFHYATKFWSETQKEFFLGFQTDGHNEIDARRQAVFAQLQKGFSEAQITAMSDLLKTDANELTVAIKAVQMVATVILPLPDGQELPENIAIAAYNTTRVVEDLFNPFKYLKGRRNRRTVENYIHTLLPDSPHVSDYAHNLGAAAHGFSKALILLRDTTDMDVRSYFASNPVAPLVLRNPLRETTLDGTFSEPLVPGKSFVSLNIGEAAKATGNDFFFFGTGIDVRQCPFRNLGFATLEEIQKKRLAS